MKIVIIEDEQLTAEDLRQTITQFDPKYEIVAMIKTVKEGIAWFAGNPLPDLVFSDIQLGDGLSFEILTNRFVPVIFCTAYDEYALDAFNANGVDYILKPFTSDALAAALQKFENLTRPKREEVARQIDAIKHLFSSTQKQFVSSILIHVKDTIVPVQVDDIALFYLQNGMVSLTTFDKRTFYPNKSLDELEDIIGPNFFRVNRQYLVHRKAIVNAANTFSRKLTLSVSVPVSEGIVISKEKAPQFLKWLTSGYLPGDQQ